MNPRPSWHALFAPLPADAVPRRQPVAPPEVLPTPAGAAIAGWEQLVLDFSAGGTAMRVVHVVLDGDGRPISASDMVFYRTGPAEIRQESVGGRFEADGSFRGTRWLTAGPEPADDEPPDWESTPSEPSAADVAALRALVDEMLRRAGGE
ncbi:MAG TPA: hypothetical protein VF830_10555 [Gemmatimonadales bacterium]